MELLEELSLVTRNSDVYYKLTEVAITTDPIIKSLAIENFQQETIRMSGEAMDSRYIYEYYSDVYHKITIEVYI